MIKKINYIWKNLLFDFIVLLILSGIVGCNLYGRNGTEHLNFTLTDKLAIGLTCILCLHLIVLLVLTIINFAQRTYFKAIIFFFICIGLYFSIKFISIFLISSTFGGTIDEGNRHNFQKSELCIHFDTIKI